MKFLSLAALALTFAACSNDDNEVIQQQASQPADGEITITATITKDGAMTRALSERESEIASTWTVGEKVAILFDYKSVQTVREAEVTAVSSGQATIQFTIPADLTGTQTATLVYPSTAVNAAKTGADVATALATQDGTITNCPEVRTGTGTLYADTHTLLVNTPLAAQNAIFKFTVQDLSSDDKTATKFKISDASGKVLTTVTASHASNTLFVALPVMAAGTYWFNATIDDKPYIARATTAAATVAGDYYSTTVRMATIGDVILSDGTFAKAGASSPVAMLAYLGNGSNGRYGLAIQLNSNPVVKQWENDQAGNYVNGLTPLLGGTWYVPRMSDWQYMFLACRKDGDVSGASSDKMEPIAGFKEKIAATGTTWQSSAYWTRSTSGLNDSRWWAVSFYFDNGYARASFSCLGSYGNFYVLGCLAF